jgi:hypothetical protein
MAPAVAALSFIKDQPSLYWTILIFERKSFGCDVSKGKNSMKINCLTHGRKAVP